MTQNNSKQNIITAVSIIVALAAVVYALMGHVEKPQKAGESEQTIIVTENKTPEKAFEAGENNPVVMTVNGKDVTRAEILENFSQSGSTLPQGMDLSQVFPMLQEQYLVGHLLESAAEDAGIDQSNPVVQERLNSVLGQAMRAAYIEKIGNEGLSEDDIRKAYDDIVGNAPALMERKASHILVDTEEAANALIVKLQNGNDFAELAKESSKDSNSENGGDLGYFIKNEMVPEFADAAFALNIGEFSATPVKTKFGYHVIKAEDERERAKPSYEEAKIHLEAQLKQAIVGEAVEKLRQDAEVVMFDMNGQAMAQETPAENQPAVETPEAE